MKNHTVEHPQYLCEEIEISGTLLQKLVEGKYIVERMCTGLFIHFDVVLKAQNKFECVAYCFNCIMRLCHSFHVVFLILYCRVCPIL